MERAMTRRLSLLCATAIIAAAGTVHANVGEPTGAGVGTTFSIRITQGGTVIVDNPAVPFPANIKTNPLTPVPIGMTSGGTPIILKIQSDFSASEVFRITHWYISTPVSVADVNTPSPYSLINPASTDPIRVEVGNIRFIGTPATVPVLANNNSFYTSYMIDSNGRYYATPGTNPYNLYGNGKVDVQVPGEKYLDGFADPYQFTSVSGAVNSWVWDKIIPPGVGTQVVQNDGSLGGTGFPSAGHVFELGLGVAFVVPEPCTMGLMAIGGLVPLLRRRRPAFRIG